MDDYISRQAAINEVRSYYDECDERKESIEERIEQLPSSDVVSKEVAEDAYAHGYTDAESKFAGVYDQVRWERDTAIAQLKELGYSLGEKVRRGHWTLQNDVNAKAYGWHICSECGAYIGEPTNYCSNCGAHMMEEE